MFSKRKEFSKLMQGEFEISLMGELTFFLGLQIKQTRDGIFLSQLTISTPIASKLSIDKDESGVEVDGRR